ncbi:MAG TPA: HAMP domain-containing sensor histidine kinase [Mycobacteriales bacterium]|nr:HAMP domain-containing sensor histidine kinase [Mycobacteriales bacterium]
MTTYPSRGVPGALRGLRAPRPTLRLRLTLLNGLLLFGAGVLLLLIMSWLIVVPSFAVRDHAMPGTKITLQDENGRRQTVDFAEWQAARAQDMQSELLAKGVLALLVIGSAGLVGAYLVSGRALRPLHQVTATARRHSTDTLDQRIDHLGPDDEVKELADTFDAMLDRLSAAFGSQQRFVANASHELRTPLSVMRTEIEVTLADPDASVTELRRMGTVVRAASDRANDLIEALLLLARTEAQAGRLDRRTPVDLAAGVRATLVAVRTQVENLQLGVRTDFRPALVVGDPNLLERLAGNLVENAVRYNVRGGQLSVRTGTDGARVYLTVANTGPEVPAAEVPGLFEPFRRGGRERTGTRGAGLGLSIVGAVAHAHGGAVRATPLAGGGLEVTVELPAAVETVTGVVSGRASVRS